MIGNRRRMLAMFVLLMGLIGTLGGCNGKRDQLARYRTQNLELQAELTRTRAALESCQNDRDSLVAEIERSQGTAAGDIRANTGFEGISGVQTFRDGGTITVRVPGDVLFASGKVTLRSSAKSTLDQVASVLTSQYAANTIRVEGYTDRDPIRRSKWKDNLELSAHRAMAVYRHLQTRGISADRMYAAGFGSTNLQASKADSRRVQIVVVLQE